jgi:acyl-CoA synthetase (AMP-forming)/AMP-acid ligase II
MHLETGAVQPLRAQLESVTVRWAGGSMSSAELSQVCSVLVEELRFFRGCRVAIASPRAEHIMAGLAAGEAAGCEILLHRSGSMSEQLLRRWNVSAVVDSSPGVKALGSHHIESSETGIVIQTSGTTGEPKLAKHTVQALRGRIRDHGRGRNRWLLTYHPATFGGLQVLLTALGTGSELVVAESPTVPALSEAAVACRPTHISGTPTFWRSFLLCLGPRASELPLAQITLGGEIADEAILERLRATFPEARINHIYASTEAGALFSVQDGQPGFPSAWLETGIDGVDLRIQGGVLQVRSPRAMKGYLNKDIPTATTPDGWLVTGDSVERVDDRVLFRGRDDAMLNVGGAKVRPEEVEALLYTLPEVEEARVYGVPNPITGMVVGADIVRRPGLTEAEARQAILAKARLGLESYKVPRIVHFVERIGISMAGKKERRA